MKVCVTGDVWSSGSTRPLDVLAVLELCDARRHVLLLSPSGRQQATQWIDEHTRDKSALKVQLLRLLEENQRAGPFAPADGAMITIVADKTDWNRARFVPTLALRLLRRPLKLLVENSRNDRAFLLKLAEPGPRDKLRAAIEAGWIEFEMGGGLSEIHQRLLGFSGDAHMLADHLKVELARLWLMFDRDIDPLDHTQESKQSRKLREYAAQLTVPWPLAAHQLERRAIENYIPAETIRGWWCGQADTNAARLARERRAEAFLANTGLSLQARQSYNMKRGLLGDLSDKRRTEIRGAGPPLDDAELDPLYRNLPPSVRGPLKTGGFKDLANAFKEPGVVSDRALNQEVRPGERRRLVASILARM